jgi:ABC-2 type transport system ATP-binding protein
MTSDRIGMLAFKAGIPLFELTVRSASLEDAFLELTADSQEYKTAKGGKS